MCTAITYKNKYFGRNLDLDYSYNETVTVTPRNYIFNCRNGKVIKNHYAVIGMANVVEGYPLYYDGVNEKGLAMAGLSFGQVANYKEPKDEILNITSFELIPWILFQCKNTEEAKVLLKNINITNLSFNGDFKPTPLHWIIADKDKALTVELTKDGVRVYDNPIGVLTNDPEFSFQMFNLNNYLNLTADVAVNRFSGEVKLEAYCKGMGAIGLPGDMSSAARFVKAAFVKLNSVSGEDEGESVGQFFHILESVFQVRGVVKTGEGKYEITYYSSCCNQEKGIYYYKTYKNSQISAVDINKENLEGSILKSYGLIEKENICYQN